MISALVTGKLVRDPRQHTDKNGNEYASALVSVPCGSGSILCSAIAWKESGRRLLRLSEGSHLAISGELSLTHWQGKDGQPQHGIRVTVDEVNAPGGRKLFKGLSDPPAIDDAELAI